MICPKCKTDNQKNEKKCVNCGEKLKTSKFPKKYLLIIIGCLLFITLYCLSFIYGEWLSYIASLLYLVIIVLFCCIFGGRKETTLRTFFTPLLLCILFASLVASVVLSFIIIDISFEINPPGEYGGLMVIFGPIMVLIGCIKCLIPFLFQFLFILIKKQKYTWIFYSILLVINVVIIIPQLIGTKLETNDLNKTMDFDVVKITYDEEKEMPAQSENYLKYYCYSESSSCYFLLNPGTYEIGLYVENSDHDQNLYCNKFTKRYLESLELNKTYTIDQIKQDTNLYEYDTTCWKNGELIEKRISPEVNDNEFNLDETAHAYSTYSFDLEKEYLLFVSYDNLSSGDITIKKIS